MSILDKANDLIHNARRESYGHPFDFYNAVAPGWSVIFGVSIPPEKVALAMDWFKTCRELNKHDMGNLEDKAGYVGTLEMYYEKRAEQTFPRDFELKPVPTLAPHISPECRDRICTDCTNGECQHECHRAED